MNRVAMVESLLEAYEAATFQTDGEQIQIWAQRVGLALEAADLSDDRQIWEKALNSTHFYDGDTDNFASMVNHAETLKAILIGIQDKIKRATPAEHLFDMEIIRGPGRPYLERIAMQANGCYHYGWFDACAVMVRRLIEILIIDCFEQYNKASEIKMDDGRYYGLEQLINASLNQTWHMPPHLKKHLPKLKRLKELGDIAAHGRTNISQDRIDNHKEAIHYSLEALIHIAHFK